MEPRGDILLFIERMLTFDFFEISGTSVRKVQGTAHASAADPESGHGKIAPKSIKNRSKIDLKFRSIFGVDFGSILGRFGTPTWRHFRPNFVPKPSWDRFYIENVDFHEIVYKNQ